MTATHAGPTNLFAGGVKLSYADWDTDALDFRGLIQEHLADAVGCADLGRFHEFIPPERMPTDPIEGTAHTYGHDILYAVDPAFRQAGYVEAKPRGFIETYRRFMRFIQDEVFGIPLVFQRLPSQRLDNRRVWRRHRLAPIAAALPGPWLPAIKSVAHVVRANR